MGSLSWLGRSDSASYVYLIRDIDCGRVARVDQVGLILRHCCSAGGVEVIAANAIAFGQTTLLYYTVGMQRSPPCMWYFIYNQRESMGLLENEAMAMPSLRDVAQDGWLCTFIIWKLDIPTSRSWAAPVTATERYGKGRRYGPSIKHAGSLSSSQPGGPPCWTSPLFFGLIVCDAAQF